MKFALRRHYKIKSNQSKHCGLLPSQISVFQEWQDKIAEDLVVFHGIPMFASIDKWTCKRSIIPV
jgi:hypothetical protein